MMGWAFGLTAKTQLGLHASHIQAARFRSWLCSMVQFPAYVHLKRQEMMVQVLGFLLPTLETWVEFWSRGLAGPNPGYSGHWEG